jgi:phage shock protein A
VAIRNLSADREAMLEEAAAALESVGAAKEAVAALQGDVHTLEAKVAGHKAKYDEALAALEERRARAAACDKEASTLAKVRGEREGSGFQRTRRRPPSPR